MIKTSDKAPGYSIAFSFAEARSPVSGLLGDPTEMVWQYLGHISGSESLPPLNYDNIPFFEDLISSWVENLCCLMIGSGIILPNILGIILIL